jgi:glycosyltransferase involved in cell wall biosynthesis
MATPGWGGVTGVGTACRGLTECLAGLGHVVDVLHIAPGRTSAVTLVDHAGNHRRPRPLQAVLRWKRDYDVVHFHDDACSDGRDGGFRAILHRHPVPAVVTLHSLATSHQAAISSTAWRRAAQEAIQADLIHRASAVIALTGHARDSLTELFPQHRDKTHVVGNGVRVPARHGGGHDLARPPGPRTDMKWGPDVRIVLYLGRLSREKGVEALAEAFVGVHAAAPDTRLVLAGPAVDDSAERSVALLRSAGLEADREFHLLGPVLPRDREAVLQDADLVVLPSRVEQHPIVPLEAMAAGRPVAVSGLPHLLALYEMADPERRLAFPIPVPSSPDAIREAVLCALWSPEREAVVRRARRAVEERLGWEAVARATLDVYERARSRRGEPEGNPPLLDSMRALWRDASAPGSGATGADRMEVGVVRLNLERAALLRGDVGGSGTAVREAAEALWLARPRDPEEGAEVCVVVPVHLHPGNPGRLGYLLEAVDSVRSQDLAHRIVLVIVDDGSTLDVEARLRARSPAEPASVRIEVLRLPHHTGHPGWARLEGYRWALRTRTPYVAHLDSDDVMLAHRLRVTRDHLEAHPEVDLVHAGHRSIDASGLPLLLDNPVDRWYAGWRSGWCGRGLDGEPGARGHHRHGPDEVAILAGHNFVHNATTLIRTTALLRVGIENLAPTVEPGLEDHELWCRLGVTGRIDYLDEVVALYRQHPESLTRVAAVRPDGPHAGGHGDR